MAASLRATHSFAANIASSMRLVAAVRRPAGERRRETVLTHNCVHLNGVKIHRTTTCAYSPAKLGKLMRRLEKRHQVNAGARRMGHMLGKSRDSGS